MTYWPRIDEIAIKDDRPLARDDATRFRSKLEEMYKVEYVIKFENDWLIVSPRPVITIRLVK